MLPMFDPKRKTVTVVQTTPGGEDLEVMAEVEGGKKLPKKLKKRAEEVMRLAKKGSLIDLAKALGKMKPLKEGKK